MFLGQQLKVEKGGIWYYIENLDFCDFLEPSVRSLRIYNFELLTGLEEYYFFHICLTSLTTQKMQHQTTFISHLQATAKMLS